MASLTLAGIVYLLAIREFFASPKFERRIARRVVVIGLVLAAMWHIEFLRMPSGPDDDIHRYVWDGRLQRLGYNPYLVIPSDPAVKALHTPETSVQAQKRGYGGGPLPECSADVMPGSRLLRGKKAALLLDMGSADPGCSSCGFPEYAAP